MRYAQFLIIGLALCCAGVAQIPAAESPSRSSVAAKADLLDINTATVDQLKALPGMGAEYARRIIAGRPYTAKNQLVTRGILPEEAYSRIAGSIIAKKAAKP